VLVAQHDAVRVAVERDAEVRLVIAHGLAQRLGIERAGLRVDVLAVGLGVDGVDLRAQLLEHRRAHAIRGAVRGVDDDRHAVERELGRKRRLAVHDVATAGVVDATAVADVGRRCALRVELRRRHQRLDLGLDLVGQL